LGFDSPWKQIFRLRLKKISLSISRQNTCLRPSHGHDRTHMGYGATVYGWGRGLGGSFNLHFLMQCPCPEGCLTPAGEFFYLITYHNTIRAAYPNATKVGRMRSFRARNIQSKADQSTRNRRHGSNKEHGCAHVRSIIFESDQS